MGFERNAAEERALFDAALAVIGENGWNEVSLRAIADKAGVSLADLSSHIAHRHALLPWLIGQIDRAVLANSSRISLDQSPRDRLFEIMMDRFDQLQPLRPILSAARVPPPLRGATTRLFDLVSAGLSLPASMSWMLELAGLPTDGISGALRVHGLAAIHLATLRVWLDDESPDLGLTMKALDTHLARAERWARLLPDARPSGMEPAESA
jgi:ubiquinone biosynthesis protein COQ9